MSHSVVGAIDPELEALPEPRRPLRHLTLATMSVTAVLAVFVTFGLGSSATFALAGGPPKELGVLTNVQLGPPLDNTWVHGTGAIETEGVEYRRPLDPDRYRLVRVEGNPKLFVELRVPSGIEPEHYVAPNSFVGRLVPLSHAGLRYGAVEDAMATVSGGAGTRAATDGAWVLVDGQAPATSRWAIGICALFVAFAAVNLWGVFRLLRPATRTA